VTSPVSSWPNEDNPCRYSNGNTSATFGDFRDHAWQDLRRETLPLATFRVDPLRSLPLPVAARRKSCGFVTGRGPGSTQLKPRARPTRRTAACRGPFDPRPPMSLGVQIRLGGNAMTDYRRDRWRVVLASRGPNRNRWLPQHPQRRQQARREAPGPVVSLGVSQTTTTHGGTT